MSQLQRKIVIFDDDVDILAICTYILEENGWSVTCFTDINDAPDKVQREQPDVILMDNWIPDEGGILATRAIKAIASLRHIPVVYFSANSDLRQLAATAGADHHLAKPFDIDQLLYVLEQALIGSNN
jgi:CheY-like chemotaxis protein